ncbi:MAG: hypothetical protein FWE01_01460 [Firmicutes bacterium]|nr:hypothetical protein [Bacillota bacterium]
MFQEFMGRMTGSGCGCNPCRPRERKCMPQLKSCDLLWIIILLMLVLNGSLFGIDLCTIAILGLIFGPQLLCRFRCRPEPRC